MIAHGKSQPSVDRFPLVSLTCLLVIQQVTCLIRISSLNLHIIYKVHSCQNDFLTKLSRSCWQISGHLWWPKGNFRRNALPITWTKILLWNVLVGLFVAVFCLLASSICRLLVSRAVIGIGDPLRTLHLIPETYPCIHIFNYANTIVN